MSQGPSLVNICHLDHFLTNILWIARSKTILFWKEVSRSTYCINQFWLDENFEQFPHSVKQWEAKTPSAEHVLKGKSGLYLNSNFNTSLGIPSNLGAWCPSCIRPLLQLLYREPTISTRIWWTGKSIWTISFNLNASSRLIDEHRNFFVTNIYSRPHVFSITDYFLPATYFCLFSPWWSSFSLSSILRI